MAEGEVPGNANQHCPGTGAEDAGKASACAGCPNQQLCASAPKGPDPAIKIIGDKMRHVRHKIVVLSGKGGVGKSTVATQLALTLAKHGQQVGLLDVDITGPSLPTMTGTVGKQIRRSNIGWEPVYISDRVGLISIGFMLPSPSDAVIWRGPKKNGMIKQFLQDVYWGDELDYLVIDTPPGTSDEHLSVVQYLAESNVDGAIIVTTPQEVSLADVRKEINFCKKVNMKILGVVENMRGYACPCCGEITDILPVSTGGGASSLGLDQLGTLPIDPLILQCCDTGECYPDPSGAFAKTVIEVTKRIGDPIPSVHGTSDERHDGAPMEDDDEDEEYV